MWALGGIHRRAALTIVGLALAMGTIALHSARGDEPSPEYSAEQLVLRLHDLPPGFVPLPLDFSEEGREFICDPLLPGEPGRRLKSFIKRFSPTGCVGLYLRAYRVPGVGPTSVLVGTGAMDVGIDAAATSGFELSGRLLHKLVDPDLLEEVAPPETIGTVTRLFHWRDVPRTRNADRGSFVTWRSSSVLAATFATAGSFATSDRIALDLARRQQVHIEDPTPYMEAERDASEVGLDDPNLKFPVYWLGHDFRPGRGLPPTHLEEGGRTSGDLAFPGQKLLLKYSENLTLSAWSEAGWRRFLTKAPPRQLRVLRCGKPTQVTLANGHATVFAGYRKAAKPCPKGRPSHYFAVARIDGTITAVNFPRCKLCLPQFPSAYNSFKGMKAVVGGLELRPKPVYPAPAQP
jgi:hypothetical protein